MRCISSLRIAASSRVKLAPPYSFGHLGTVRPRATQRSSQSFCASDRHKATAAPANIVLARRLPHLGRAVGFEPGAKFNAVHRHRASSLSAGSDLRAGIVHGRLDFVDRRANAPFWPSPISALIEVSAYGSDGARPPLGWADGLRVARRSPTRSEHVNRNVCSRGDLCRRALRSTEAVTAAVCTVCFTSIRDVVKRLKCANTGHSPNVPNRPILLKKSLAAMARC